MLRDDVVLKVRENGGRIPVNISEGLAAFPEPTSQWSKDGQLLDGSRPELTYSTVTLILSGGRMLEIILRWPQTLSLIAQLNKLEMTQAASIWMFFVSVQ